MERRKFLIGMGTAAAGSAATIGTGAFSMVWANRDVTAKTTGDASAYLGLNPQSKYASIDGKELTLDFDSLNENANSRFYNVFWIRNNGTQDVSVKAHTLDNSGNLDGWTSSDFALYWSQNEINNNGSFVFEAMHDTGNVSDPSGNGPDENIPRLSPGEAIAVHPHFFLEDDNGAGDTPAEIAFYATTTNY